MTIRLIRLLSFLCLSILISCNSQYEVDISGIEVNIQIRRFEQDLFKAGPEAADTKYSDLKAKYPEFFDLYVENIMQFKRSYDSTDRYHNHLAEFLSNKNIQGLNDSCQAKYPDLNDLKQKLEEAFTYHKYYFPDSVIPGIVTFISEFGYGAVTTDDLIGLGLDMHLGKDYIYYPSIGLPNYMIRKLRPEYMIVNCMKVWARQLFPEPEADQPLLDHMIYNGKIMHYLDHVLPAYHDTLKIGQTKTGYDWCYDNESDIWTFFIKNDLVYSTNVHDNRKFINDGQTTPGMPHDSPGNVGTWLGWQIVSKFAEQNPEISFNELMKIGSGQEILERSSYKPKRGIL
ncbi:MAG: hypothetical protein IH946_00810 [Bacteroidetes bacterium]|nr:hypothetical protein [Bacteroidota bacterium]